MAEAVGGMTPVEVTSGMALEVEEVVEPSPPPDPRSSRASEGSSFREKLAAGEFVVSVEIDPPRGIDASRLVKGAAICAANGVDAINIADSPLARARMTPLALATLIRQNVDIEIILHMSCRDRNILGLQSECMGSHALGTRNLLCVTGDPPQMGDYPDATGVFDVDAIGLVGLLKRLNQGNDLAGKKIDYATDFFLGVASNPTAVDLAIEQERFHQKVEAGAQFTMTQPLYDLADMDRWLDEVPMTIPLLVGILPLRNGRHADFLHHEVPGMHVPQDIRDRMHAAGDDGPREGVAIAQEFLSAVQDRVQGVYLMPPFNRFEMAVDVCKVLK
jgi:5,10-methylenetetrahydrofolate reductase